MAPTGPGIRCHISPLWSKGNSAVYAARALEADDLWGVWQLRCVSQAGVLISGFQSRMIRVRIRDWGV